MPIELHGTEVDVQLLPAHESGDGAEHEHGKGHPSLVFDQPDPGTHRKSHPVVQALFVVVVQLALAVVVTPDGGLAAHSTGTWFRARIPQLVTAHALGPGGGQ